ncbi:Copper amine oxidase N-terminal domain-containing protein [[Clostridium] propionicum DSM 1682]|uniref:Copper amine oxidase N-terminal domain-containing protein n=2 Tax=Anaerotignum propionicum TaxID=28446 RepID=A0A0X1U925_ANAPI|nr:copper amine oxidase N-terminal domain-containing protein [Anaerotignum propionicum]AMJ41429.1 hypothetical protein CPRO_18450 [Anaerotignum propionicum DSM 1682]SHE68196.1 Copper amine oxidase N-terminal domain-containing protein [[Clostridium] propionicum DSM 1682] [Anaerotignum propionicum DSM 1682]
MLPVRTIFEALGLGVGWDESTGTIIGTKDGLVITLQIDNKEAKVNDKAMMLDVPATVIDNRTVVPARFVAEATGADVDWDGSTRTFYIDTTIESNLNVFGGNVKNVEIKSVKSNIFSENDIESAINTVIAYFKAEFSGCTLTEIVYAGDDKQEFAYLASQYNADEVIVLVSSFDVDSSGGDGSLTPNSTYSDWKWILVRDRGGQWKHFDHGY